MEMNQMRYFLEVAETQHMTHSAKRLRVAQPALSQSISRLEKSLGVPLFAQKGRNIVLTEYGRYLKERLAPIVEELDAIPTELATMTELQTQTIHINVLAASTFVTEAIIEYKKRHGGVNFQLLQSTESDLFDIEITTQTHDEKNWCKADGGFICSEKIYLAVPADSKYSERSSIDLKDVSGEGFVSLLGSRQLRLICDNFCADVGFSPRVVFESDSPSAVRNMIAASIGVGFWPEFTWGEVSTENVHLLEIKSPDCKRDIVITQRHNKTDNSNVVDFFDFLVDYTKKLGFST